VGTLRHGLFALVLLLEVVLLILPPWGAIAAITKAVRSEPAWTRVPFSLACLGVLGSWAVLTWREFLFFEWPDLIGYPTYSFMLINALMCVAGLLVGVFASGRLRFWLCTSWGVLFFSLVYHFTPWYWWLTR
jgi:hypothetical protein